MQILGVVVAGRDTIWRRSGYFERWQRGDRGSGVDQFHLEVAKLDA